MINIITGTPGSGKTYLMLKLLTDQHFTYDKRKKEFVRKKKSEKYTIFANIDELKLEHKNLDEIFKNNNLTFDTFFSKSYQDKLHEKYKHVIYIIDECQRFIPYNYKNQDVLFYFDYHRHYGDTIYLITQDYTKISKAVNVLAELEYRAVKSTFSLLGEFKYNIKSGGDIFKRKVCKKDQRIFNIYKSFGGDDQIKHFNPMFILIPFFLLMFVGFGWYFFHRMSPGHSANDIANKKKHSHVQLKKKQNITQFKQSSLVQVQQSFQPLPPQQKFLIRINDFIVKNNKITLFRDPITHKFFQRFEFPYPVLHLKNRFFIYVSVSDRDQWMQINSIAPNSDDRQQTQQQSALIQQS